MRTLTKWLEGPRMTLLQPPGSTETAGRALTKRFLQATGDMSVGFMMCLGRRLKSS